MPEAKVPPSAALDHRRQPGEGPKPKVPPAVKERIGQAFDAIVQAVGTGLQKTGKPLMRWLRTFGDAVENLRPGQVEAILLNLLALPLLAVYYWIVIAAGLLAVAPMLEELRDEDGGIGLANVLALGILACSWASYKMFIADCLNEDRPTGERAFRRALALVFIIADFLLSLFGFMQDNAWSAEGFSVPGAFLLTAAVTAMIVLLSYFTVKLCQNKE